MIQKTSLLILIITIAATSAGSAQSNQLWGSVELTESISEPWDLANTISWRQSVEESDWRRALVQLTAIYSLGIFQFMGTGAVFYTTGDEDPNIMEIRPWQGISARFPDWKRLELVHFLRLKSDFNWKKATGPSRRGSVMKSQPELRSHIKYWLTQPGIFMARWNG